MEVSKQYKYDTSPAIYTVEQALDNGYVLVSWEANGRKAWKTVNSNNYKYYIEVKPKHKVKIRLVKTPYSLTVHTVLDRDFLSYGTTPYTEVEIEIEEP